VQRPPEHDSLLPFSVVPRLEGPALSVRVEAERSPTKLQKYETQPGMLLFRKNEEGSGVKRMLLVFLVGETATAGVHKEAFLASMRLH